MHETKASYGAEYDRTILNTYALGTQPFVDFSGKDGVILARSGDVAPIVVGKDDFAGVLRAARDLQRDIGNVTGKMPRWDAGKPAAATYAIVVGTLGRHTLVDQLAQQGKIDTSQLAGQWEGFIIQAVDNPVPGVRRALVIAGSDKRGTIYGIYTLSEPACERLTARTLYSLPSWQCGFAGP